MSHAAGDGPSRISPGSTCPYIIVGMSGPARRQYAAYGTAIVLVLGGCFVARVMNGGEHKDAAKASTRPSAAITPAQYSDLLAEADSAIGTDFRRLDTTDPQTLAGAVPIAAQTMYAQVRKLQAIDPPAAAAATHASLIAELSGFSDMIQRVGTDQATPTCPAASSGPYDALLTSSFADRLRADARVLLTIDKSYLFASFLPSAPDRPTSRPATGTLVAKPSRHGGGELKIANGGPDDTAVSLVPAAGGHPLLTVYVRGGNDTTVRRVGTGTYRIYYESGSDWNPDRAGFMTGCAFNRFDQTYRFRAYPVIDTWSISITPVAGGQASTSGVDPTTFPTG